MKAQGMPWMNKALNLVWYSHWGSVPATIALAVEFYFPFAPALDSHPGQCTDSIVDCLPF